MHNTCIINIGNTHNNHRAPDDYPYKDYYLSNINFNGRQETLRANCILLLPPTVKPLLFSSYDTTGKEEDQKEEGDDIKKEDKDDKIRKGEINEEKEDCTTDKGDKSINKEKRKTWQKIKGETYYP